MTEVSTERLRHLVRFVVEKQESDDEVPCIDLEHVETATGRLTNDVDNLVALPGDRVRFAAGDVLVSKLNPYLAKSWRATVPGAASSELMVLRPTPRLNPRWLAYVVQSAPFVDFTVATAKGVKMPRTSPEEVGDYRLRLPNLAEQEQLADFLDRETQRIDAAADSNQKLGRLLEERKTSVAVDAVVRLPLVPLKRLLASVSGGEWGGEPGSSEVDVWCFRSADFDRSRHLLLSDRVPLRSLTWKQLSANELHPGDLVLEKSGGGPSTPVGCSVLATEGSLANGPSVCSNFAARLRPRADVLPEYLQIVLAGLHRSGALVPFIKQTTGLQNLDLPAVLQLRVPIAETGQQSKIVQHVLSVWEEVSATQDLLRQEEVLIAERRQALITAAVSGQLDVEAVA